MTKEFENKIRESATYNINAERVKEVERQRGISGYRIGKKDVVINYRSFKRNLSTGKMKGETLLIISEVLNVTPYYFLEPCPLIDNTLLPFDHYRIQTLDFYDTLRDFLLVRGAKSEEIALLHQDLFGEENVLRNQIEEYVETFIKELRNDINSKKKGR